MPIIQTSDNSSFFHIFGSGGYQSIYDGEADDLKEELSSSGSSENDAEDDEISLSLVPSTASGTGFTKHGSKLGSARFSLDSGNVSGRDLRLVVTSSQRGVTGKTELSRSTPLSLFGEELPSPVHHFFSSSVAGHGKNGNQKQRDVVERLSSLQLCSPVHQTSFSFDKLPDIVSPQIAHGKSPAQQTVAAGVTDQKLNEASNLENMEIVRWKPAARAISSISLNPASVIPNGFSRGASSQNQPAKSGATMGMHNGNIERQVIARQQTLIMPEIHKQKKSKEVNQFSPRRHMNRRAEHQAAGQPNMTANRPNFFVEVLSPSPEVKEAFRLDHWDGESAYPIRTESSRQVATEQGQKKKVTMSAVGKTRQKTSRSDKNASGRTSRAEKSRASKRSNASIDRVSSGASRRSRAVIDRVGSGASKRSNAAADSSRKVEQDPGLGGWTPRSPTEHTKSSAPSTGKTSRHGIALLIPGMGNLEEYVENLQLPHTNVLAELSSRRATKREAADRTSLQVHTDLDELLSSRQKPAQVRTSPIKAVVSPKRSALAFKNVLDAPSEEGEPDRFLDEDPARSISPFAQRVIELEERTPMTRPPTEPQLPEPEPRSEDYQSDWSNREEANLDAGSGDEAASESEDEATPEFPPDSTGMSTPTTVDEDNQVLSAREEAGAQEEEGENFDVSEETGNKRSVEAAATTERGSSFALADGALTYFATEGGVFDIAVETGIDVPSHTPSSVEESRTQKGASAEESRTQKPAKREPPKREAAPFVFDDVGMELNFQSLAMTKPRPMKGVKREAHKTALQHLAHEGVRSIPMAPERPRLDDDNVKPSELVYWGTGVPFDKGAEDHTETIDELWKQAEEREEQKIRKKAGISDVVPQMEFQPRVRLGRGKQNRSRRERRRENRILEKLVLDKIQQREDSLQNLKRCISSMEYGDEVPEDSQRIVVVSLLLELRARSLAVCEAIWSWQHETRQPAKPFVWKGEDYIDKLAHDLEFTSRYVYIVKTLNVQGPFSLANSTANRPAPSNPRHAMMVRKQADVSVKEKALRTVSQKDDARIKFCLKNIQRQQPSVRWQLDDDDMTEPPTTGHGRKVTISRGTTGLSRGTSSLGSRGTERGRYSSDGMPFGEGRASPFTPTPILKPASRRMGTGSTSPLLELLVESAGKQRTTDFQDVQEGESGRSDYLRIERGDSTQAIEIPDEPAQQKVEPDEVSGRDEDFNDQDWLARQPRVTLKSGSGRNMMRLNVDEALATVVINDTNDTAPRTEEMDDRRLRRKLRSRKGAVTFDRHPRSYEETEPMQTPRQLDRQTMHLVFQSMDQDGDGLIVYGDLTEELSSLPLQADPSEVSEMFMRHAKRSTETEPAMDLPGFSAMLPELQRMYKILRGQPEGLEGTELYSFVVGAQSQSMDVPVEPEGDEERGGEDELEQAGVDSRVLTSMTRTSDGTEQFNSRALTSMTRTSDGLTSFADDDGSTRVESAMDGLASVGVHDEALTFTFSTRSSSRLNYDELTFDLTGREDSGNQEGR